MINEIIQGHESAAYGMLGRMMVTEHGMAYSPRGPGSRSAHMSRGSRVPPGRSATPTTGQRGTGVCGAASEEVGEMPRAEPATTPVLAASVIRAVVGRPRSILTVIIIRVTR